MNNQRVFYFRVVSILLIILIIAGCSGNATEPASVPSAPPEVVATTAAAIESTPVPVADTNLLYQDDFTNPASGWPEEKFDNYFIGYHEPEYYHVEITSANYKTTVPAPGKQSFNDTTIEVKALTNAGKTSETGDFSYGVMFRRSGDQYYAFTISPRAKKWYVLKSSPNALVTLAEGDASNINELGTLDALRVNIEGSNFTFYINDQLAGNVTDTEYVSGETGFYVQTVDVTQVHIHFDSLSIRNVEAVQPEVATLYQDDFTNPASGWPEEKFDNYFIGYHEPEYYHVEITSPNYKTTVFAPEKQSFNDTTIEVQVLTNAGKTSETGDFSYGPVFRRSGDQYYAFTISPRAKKWYVLKSSSNALSILAEGDASNINELSTIDVLRVDTQGANFSFYINDQAVGQATDSDYVSGEVGFYVQTVDATQVHIHFDSLSIRDVETSQPSIPEAVTLYEDIFTNPASGWAEKKFDNYFIGYHEPEYYHIEITSSNYKTTVFAPEKQSFDDTTIEVQVLTNAGKTSESGDFSYGPAFRRSGDQYYAFTISPRAKKWYVLKSSPNALVPLAEGDANNINELGTIDVLRVDMQGSNFSFYINDQLVGQVTDSEYASGEDGFYVQTVDATQVHIHFDSLSIKEFAASLTCTVKALALNVRSGPGTGFGSFTVLRKDDIITPLERSADDKWLKIKLEKHDTPGWVFNTADTLSCSGAVNSIPLVTP